MRSHLPQLFALLAAPLWVAAATGLGVAWWLHRRTTLSAWNVYLAAAVIGPLSVAGAMTGPLAVKAGSAIALVGVTAAALAARRWRLGALGAGGELRQYERARRMIWQRQPRGRAGERVFIVGQGELVRERGWPEHVGRIRTIGGTTLG